MKIFVSCIMVLKKRKKINNLSYWAKHQNLSSCFLKKLWIISLFRLLNQRTINRGYFYCSGHRESKIKVLVELMSASACFLAWGQYLLAVFSQGNSQVHSVLWIILHKLYIIFYIIIFHWIIINKRTFASRNNWIVLLKTFKNGI